MSKVIIKTALKTLCVLVAAFIIAALVASFGFPASMASLFEKGGNYSVATGYAELNYNYTGKIGDLDRCLKDSILAGNDKNVVKFGDKLISDGNFKAYCADKDTTVTVNGETYTVRYYGYVAAKVTCAKYSQGDFKGAFALAKSAMEGEEGFPAGNALAQLSVAVINKKDKPAAAEIYEYLSANPQEGDYYATILTEIRKLKGE